MRTQEMRSVACVHWGTRLCSARSADTPRGSLGSGFSTEAAMQKVLIKNSSHLFRGSQLLGFGAQKSHKNK